MNMELFGVSLKTVAATIVFLAVSYRMERQFPAYRKLVRGV
jgi:hypothetical protein